MRDMRIISNYTSKVELLRPSLVRGIVTQGRHVNPLTLCCVQRVTQYKVMWSKDGVNWNIVQDSQGNDKVNSRKKVIDK